MTIPKSVKKERITENFNIFNFELSTADVEAIGTLDMEPVTFLTTGDPEIIK